MGIEKEVKKEKMNVGNILGIDLGTTNSVVTLYDGKTQQYIPIPSLEGHPLIPSIFYMKDNVIRVGEKAREEIKIHPNNVVTSAKTLMDSPKHKYNIKGAINRNGEVRDSTLTPIDISAYILRYIKKCAEEFIGEPIKDVVITCPSYFKEVERKATTRAAEKAGLNLVEIINEPTSACLAYGYATSKDDDEKTILAYDLGGGTFDVTLLKMSPEVYEVISTDGMKIGGDNIDLALLEHLRKKGNLGKATDKQAKLIVEEVKKQLSDNDKVTADFKGYGGGTFEVTLKEFEKLISPIVNQTITKVLNLIEGEGTIDEVVLVGGSTRIPLVRKRLIEMLSLDKNYFDKYKVDPDLAVSIGACRRGRIILGDTDIILIDRTPFDIGIELDTGEMDPIISRGSIIPTTGHATYINSDDEDSKVEFRVYQGNDLLAKSNQFLGVIKFEIDTSLSKKVKFKVSFSLDESGVLSVEVLNLLSRERQQVKVSGVID